MQSGDIEGLEHSSIDVDAKRAVIYGWDSVNLSYTRIACDIDGKLKINLVGNIIVYHLDGSFNFYTPTDNTDISRGDLLFTIIRYSLTYDTIVLGEGTFDLGLNVLTLLDGQKLIGAGYLLTTISSQKITPFSNIIIPAEGSNEIEGIHLYGNVSGTNSISCIGHPTGAQNVNVIVRRCWLDAHADNVYFAGSTGTSYIKFENCLFNSQYDVWNDLHGASTPTKTVEFIGCTMYCQGQMQGTTNPVRGINTTGSGTYIIRGCYIYSSSHNTGITPWAIKIALDTVYLSGNTIKTEYVAPAWGTGLSYKINDLVTQSATVYICLVNHTSGDFTTDLGAGDWTTSTIPTTTQSIYNSGTGNLFIDYYLDDGTTNIISSFYKKNDSPSFVRGTFTEPTLSPFVITSNILNTNLNADLWDGYQFSDYLNQAVKTTSNPTFASVSTSTINPSSLLTIHGNLTVDNAAYSGNTSTITMTGALGFTSTILAISSSSTDKTITFPDFSGYPLLTTANTPTVYMPLCGATSNPGVVQSVATGTLAYPLCYNSSSSLPSFQICTVPGGGTGTTSFTAYMPILGGTTTTNPLQSVATGTIYYPLCYNTSSTKPTFQLLDLRGGGTGRASDTAYALISGGTTTTAAQVSIANSATVGAIFRGAGTSAYAGWTLATITESGNDVTLKAAGAGTITFAPGTASSDPYWLSSSGKIGLGGTAITNNESLLFDFETTANKVGISSATGVTEMVFTGITLTAPYFEISTAPTANSTGTVAIVAKDANLLTANAEWIAIKNSSGQVRYIPVWA